MENKNLIFVYGTLRKNEGNHFLLDGATCIAQQAWTNGMLFDTGFGYPAMIIHEEGKVYGELYEISDMQLAKIDSLEGFAGEGLDNLYDRHTQKVYTELGEKEALVYVMDKKKTHILKEIIELSDWKVYRLLNQRNILYFAYGSCMDDARFKKARVIHHFKNVMGQGILNRYKLCFSRKAFDGGRADIVEEPEADVEGKVYKITPKAISYLYKREGVNSGCYRPAVVQIKMADKELQDALTFVVVEKEEESIPPAHYMEEIIRGGKGFLSLGYMKNLELKFSKKEMV